MRSSKKRSRSNQNRPRTLGNIINRVFDSSGPEGKVRGTPQQIIEKYQMLARDAQLSNDRVAAENFLQHAEQLALGARLGAAQQGLHALEDLLGAGAGGRLASKAAGRASRARTGRTARTGASATTATTGATVTATTGKIAGRTGDRSGASGGRSSTATTARSATSRSC